MKLKLDFERGRPLQTVELLPEMPRSAVAMPVAPRVVANEVLEQLGRCMTRTSLLALHGRPDILKSIILPGREARKCARQLEDHLIGIDADDQLAQDLKGLVLRIAAQDCCRSIGCRHTTLPDDFREP